MTDTIEKWSNYLQVERRYSPLTVRAYVDDVEVFVKYIEAEQFDPRTIQFNDLRSYVMFMVERGDNPRSVNRHVSAIKSHFTYLVRYGVLTKNPSQRLRTLPQKSTLPEFIPQKTSDQIIKHLFDWIDDPIEQRNSLIVILLYTTGMRRAELASLRVGDVDIAQQKIRVMGKGAKEREIPLLPEVCEFLERFLQNNLPSNICTDNEKLVLLTNNKEPITTAEIYRIVRQVLKDAGVQGKQSPHVLRHTFATHLMAQGASVRSIQELLGHKSLSSTEIYTHNTIERLKESYAKAHPRAKKL